MLIGETVTLRPRRTSARWDNLPLGHCVHIALYLGFRLAGTFWENVPAKLHPRLSDAIATRLFCDGLLCVGRICWVQSGPKCIRTPFDILLGQRLGVLALEQCLQRDELQRIIEAVAKWIENDGRELTQHQPATSQLDK